MSEAAINALAGAAGGVLSFAATYPLLTIVTKMQARSGQKGEDDKSILDAIKQVIEKEGISGLYSGIQSGCFANGVTFGTYYYWYALFRGLAERVEGTKELGTIGNLTSSSLGGVAAVFCTNPIWVVNTRAQVSGKPAKQVIKDLIEEKGYWDGLWQGVKPALALVSNPVIQFLVYESLKTRYILMKKAKGQKGVLTAFEVFYLGALAKAVATALTYPVVTLKTIIQTDSSVDGIADAANRVYSAHGLPGFFKGIEGKMAQTVLTAALLMLFQDRIRNGLVIMLGATAKKTAAAVSK